MSPTPTPAAAAARVPLWALKAVAAGLLMYNLKWIQVAAAKMRHVCMVRIPIAAAAVIPAQPRQSQAKARQSCQQISRSSNRREVYHYRRRGWAVEALRTGEHAAAAAAAGALAGVMTCRPEAALWGLTAVLRAKAAAGVAARARLLLSTHTCIWWPRHHHCFSMRQQQQQQQSLHGCNQEQRRQKQQGETRG
jgi:hypothetical protein